MKKKVAVIFAVFFLISILTGRFPALAADSSDTFGDIADYLDSIYGIDDNAGLTAFPVLNVPMGGRSEGMAQAFSAVADDVSFIEYNPAGSSMLAKSELAFFHNNWIADTKLEGAAYATRLGNLGLAGGAKWLYTPFTEYNFYGERVSKGYYSEAVAILNASYNFLAGYYFSGVSLGMNLKGAFRFMPDYTDNIDNIIAGSGASQSAMMVMADFGALTRFDLFKFYNAQDRNASAALVLKNLGPPALDDPMPTAFSAAISYKPIRPLLLALDLTCPLNLSAPELSEKLSWSIGTAVQVSSFLSMRGGILFKAGSSRFAVGSAIMLDKIAIDLNYTLDLLTQLQPLNRVSIGVRFDLGDQGRARTAEKVNALYLDGLDAYAKGDFEEAKRCWDDVLRLNPKFDPAQECLIMLHGLEEIEQRVSDLQRLDS